MAPEVEAAATAGTVAPYVSASGPLATVLVLIVIRDSSRPVATAPAVAVVEIVGAAVGYVHSCF